MTANKSLRLVVKSLPSIPLLQLLSDNLSTQPDDLIFYRPTQSEAVLLQFGDLGLWDSYTQSIAWLPVFNQNA